MAYRVRSIINFIRHHSPVNYKKLRLAVLGAPVVILLAFLGSTGGSYRADYGLDAGVAMGKFLNGNLPSVDPDISLDWTIVDAFPNLTFVNPIYLLQEPGSNDLWVAEHAGKIYRFPRDENVTADQRTLILDISSQVKQDDVSGIKSFVFHPEYGLEGSPNANYVYLFYRYTPNPPASDDDAYLRVSRFSVKEDGKIDKASEFVLIHQFSANRWHDGGDMLFDAVGFLYISLGEDTNVRKAQTLDQGLFGGVLRIDVDMDASRSHPIRRQPTNFSSSVPAGWQDSYSQGYYIPDDNPWVDESGQYLEEYYAVGLRAPHRMTYDAVEDQIWIGEVGEWQREQINILEKKANYGWPVWEGTQPGDKVGNVVLTEGDLTFPIYEYPHSVGQAIIGGHVYRGAQFAMALGGKYIYADYNTRNVYALSFDALTGDPIVQYLAKAPVGGLLGGIGKDADEELYFIRFAGYKTSNGRIFKLQKTSEVASDPPALLSEIGAFTNLAAMTPIDALIPYEVINPLWSDGAEKKRWFAIPSDGSHNYSHEQIAFSEEGNWDFPVGTVIVKHFEYNGKKIETRFLVRSENSQWYGLSYRWKADQTDAELLDDGLVEDIDVGDETIEWQFPSRTQCFQCHTDNQGIVLGLRTHQLNKEILYPRTGRVANQLDTYAHIGLLGDVDETIFDSTLTSAALDDESADLGFRVRSYLDSNCSHCHQPSGTAVGLFDARLTTPLEQQKIINGPIVKPIVADPVVIAPGDKESSVMYVRMSSLEEGIAMPPLAKHKIDEQALAVLSDWIDKLGEDPNLPVELTGLEGIVDGPSVILQWNTLSEQNNYGFEVERRTRTTAYETISFVEGMGTTDVEQSYRFVDAAPASNGEALLYRLKQIDFDGRFEYSPEIEVQPQAPLEAVLHDNYPDPFNPTTTIEYEVPAQVQVTLIVFDMLGREVVRLVDADQHPGRYSVTLDASNLPSGTYIYRLVAGNRAIAKKLVLAK